jgi:hypothetical protein
MGNFFDWIMSLFKSNTPTPIVPVIPIVSPDPHPTPSSSPNLSPNLTPNQGTDPKPDTKPTPNPEPAPAVFTPAYNGGVELTLKRTYQEKETLGILLLKDGTELVKTLELPDKNNQAFISCIPEGNYAVKRTIHPKHGECFQIMDVPGGRTDVLFHVANTVKDIEGCVAVGIIYGILAGLTAVLESEVAYKKFMDYLTGVSEFYLTICKA